MTVDVVAVYILFTVFSSNSVLNKQQGTFQSLVISRKCNKLS